MYCRGARIGYFCLVAVLVATAATAKENSDTSDGGRIVGGQETTIERVPYLVQMRERSGRFFCGGTLVTSRHVVTAAHCLDRISLSNIVVVAGASTISERGEQRSIEFAFKHPLYNMGIEANYDAAVLILNAPVSGAIARTMSLSTRAVMAGEQIQVSGWGLTFENGSSPSARVRTVSVPVFPQSKCISQYGSSKISESMFCASVPGTKDSCSGDSGGPAICGNELCGIVSWGYGCARAQRPGVYTNVITVLPFIRDCLKY